MPEPPSDLKLFAWCMNSTNDRLVLSPCPLEENTGENTLVYREEKEVLIMESHLKGRVEGGADLSGTRGWANFSPSPDRAPGAQCGMSTGARGRESWWARL